MTGTRVTIFELVNDVNKEIYVGACGGTAQDALAELRRAPPPALAHWDFRALPSEALRVIEGSLEAEGAGSFIATYTTTELPDGWRFLR
jgi:hypothetical protein